VSNPAPSTWLGIDTRRLLPAADLALVTLDGEASMAHDRQHLELPATMHLMRDAMAGQPKAASYTPPSGASSDREDPGAVDGEVSTGHHDPTGDAGTSGDRAVKDLRRLRFLVDQRVRITMEVDRLMAAYPTQHQLRPDIEATPGEDWCLSCWKDAKYHAPVALRPDGTQRFRGLCRWCGEFHQANGFEAPTWLLHLKHQGERITLGHVGKARDEHRQAMAAKGKGKRKGKNRGAGR
jgi:hypothetical protein